MKKCEVSDNQREQIKNEIPPETSTCGKAWRDPGELINAIIWVVQTGAPWCELPEEYRSRHTAYNNFRKRTEDGTIRRISGKATPEREEAKEIQPDGTYVCAHQHSAGAKKFRIKRKSTVKPVEEDDRTGRSRGGLTLKIRAVVNGTGQPMKFIITTGNVNDPTETADLLRGIPEPV